MKKSLALKAIQSVCLLALVVANASTIGIGVALAQSTTTITFDESVSFAIPGFNGKANPFLISTDGQFRVEAFAANDLPFTFNGAAFHFSQFFPCTLEEWGRVGGEFQFWTELL